MLLLLLLLRFRCATLLASFRGSVATLEIDDRSTSREGFWIYFAYCLFHSLHSTLEQTPHYLGPPRPRTQTRTHTHTHPRGDKNIQKKKPEPRRANQHTHTAATIQTNETLSLLHFFYTACCGNRILPWPASSHLRGRTHSSCDPQRNICTIFVRIFFLI